ncbi:K channel inward rectifier conserved region 2 domain protein [Fibrisoma limi BUZ 3]|uniref:K channel inward rectifier conserved region 2 domain protein n=1 Tax=Fibrisoma limi BUZ 3 TaxID=1185876 RepID=I2GN01_9BACT|nr:ion channel [Fibrisoma limi]CCH55279.1 K channel inward rectifier conserved region 2 domain protein [Fibrisoma limi BUZ 3]
MKARSTTLTQSGSLHGGDSKLVLQEEQRQDLGFGTKLNDPLSRLINKDGSFNIQRANEPFWDRVNLYNRLITMSWPQFLALVGLFYLTVNLLFAGIYLLLGAENLKGIADLTLYGRFWNSFFFSAQTLTTVGYGHIYPNSFITSTISSFESLVGLLAFALVTGLLYGRFSRPVAHIRFAKQAVFAPYLDVNAWMFRIINARSNQLIDVEVEVSLSRLEVHKGVKQRRYYTLNLERKKVTFFPTNWTLVHPITDESPLHGCTPEDLAESDAEFLILLRAIDDTFSQTVHARCSYRYNEVLWGHKYQPMFDGSKQGVVTLDLNLLDATTPAALN